MHNRSSSLISRRNLTGDEPKLVPISEGRVPERRPHERLAGSIIWFGILKCAVTVVKGMLADGRKHACRLQNFTPMLTAATQADPAKTKCAS